MATVTSKDGTHIAFEQIGQGQAVILVDGAMGYRDHHGGRPLAAALSKGFTIITYDRRGRGESTDTQPYAVEREIEDIEALIDHVGAPVYLYGFSSGSVLALRASAKLGNKVSKLVVHEPPFGAKEEFAPYNKHMNELLAAGKRGEAVSFFLQDMVPPEVLDGMKQSPGWATMEGVAHTLAYDNAVMGDGALPADVAKAATMPTLILDGSDSMDFKHEAVDELAKVMPNAERRTLEGHSTVVPPDVLAPVLIEFFGN